MRSTRASSRAAICEELVGKLVPFSVWLALRTPEAAFVWRTTFWRTDECARARCCRLGGGCTTQQRLQTSLKSPYNRAQRIPIASQQTFIMSCNLFVCFDS